LFVYTRCPIPIGWLVCTSFIFAGVHNAQYTDAVQRSVAVQYRGDVILGKMWVLQIITLTIVSVTLFCATYTEWELRGIVTYFIPNAGDLITVLYTFPIFDLKVTKVVKSLVPLLLFLRFVIDIIPCLNIPFARTLRITCDKFSLRFLSILRLPFPRPTGGGGGGGGEHNHIYLLQYREYA
jgi:hypothetical protein